MTNNEDKTLVSLINPKFTFQFGDKEYQVRKANMTQVIQFQQRAAELLEDTKIPPPARDAEMLAYCIFLLLKNIDQEVTEQFVKDNLPGNADGLDILVKMGFIDPQKLELVKKAQERLIIQNSSLISATEQDGLQSKSEN
jgi:hypothetical protein